MNLRPYHHAVIRWLAVAVAAIVASGIVLPASAQAAPGTGEPSAQLVAFASQVEINGKPYTAGGSALAPTPFPPSGYHTFTRANPFWSFADSNGDGYQQVSYATNTEQWGYTLSSAVQAIVVGNVSENADLYHGSSRTNFGAHTVGASYFFHGSSGRVSHSGTYAVTILINFRCNIGANCNGTVSAKWTWLYSNS